MKSEQELRDAVAQSREEGFRELFAQYSGYVYAIIWYRIRGLGTHEDAEEAVSDVFAKVFGAFDSIGQGNLQNYIRTAAKHMAIDTFRRLSARQEMLTDEADSFIEAESSENVAQSQELSEIRQFLLDAIQSLGEPDTSIVMLKCFYDYRLADIARYVHLTPGSVQKRLSRAKKKLRQILTDAGYLP